MKSTLFLFIFISAIVFSNSIHANMGADNAARVATSDPACVAIQPFYWEIGSSATALASGQVGDDTYNAHSQMPIASASKWVFSAYVVERRQGVLSAFDIKSLGMASGYIHFHKCLISPSETVASCLARVRQPIYAPLEDGKFHYNSGPFEVWGYMNGLGSMNRAQLTNQYGVYLGQDLGMALLSPLFAGAIYGSPSDYARFLRKILRGELAISHFLGAYPRCTNPATCPTSIRSPVPYSWHYSLGHWVEDDPQRKFDDGSFSSPGAFGFYPWISSNKRFYGVLARKDNAKDAYLKSIECGQRIRKAFLSSMGSRK